MKRPIGYRAFSLLFNYKASVFVAYQIFFLYYCVNVTHDLLDCSSFPIVPAHLQLFHFSFSFARTAKEPTDKTPLDERW
jgi:hypothetical protein